MLKWLLTRKKTNEKTSEKESLIDVRIIHIKELIEELKKYNKIEGIFNKDILTAIKIISKEKDWQNKIDNETLVTLEKIYKEKQEFLKRKQKNKESISKNISKKSKSFENDMKDIFIDSNVYFEKIEKEKKEIIEEAKNFKRESIIRQQTTLANLADYLHNEYPSAFLAGLHYCSHSYINTIEEFQSKINIMINRIEEKTGRKFYLEDLFKENCLENNYTEENLSILPEERIYTELENITKIIELNKTGDSDKNRAFINSKGEYCTTENAVIDYLKQNGHKVIYAENNFWKPLTVLAYFEEIYTHNWSGLTMFPQNILTYKMYIENQKLFDKKTEYLKNCRLKDFIQEQINYYGFINNNIFRSYKSDYINFINNVGMYFLEKIPNDFFTKIVSRIVSNGVIYGKGLPDLIVEKEDKIKLIEVKRISEPIREMQLNWIVYFRKNNIPIEIIRVKDTESNSQPTKRILQEKTEPVEWLIMDENAEIREEMF